MLLSPPLSIKRTNNPADFLARVDHPWRMGTQLYPYKPETITWALRNLRAQIIRNGEPGMKKPKLWINPKTVAKWRKRVMVALLTFGFECLMVRIAVRARRNNVDLGGNYV